MNEQQNLLEKEKRERVHTLQDAPIAHMPNEILTQIFIDASSEPTSIIKESTIRDGTEYAEMTGYRNMEVVISHVCGQWRALSLGIRSLWTTIYFVAHLSSTRDNLPRLEAYFGRSGSRLLDIWIDLKGRAPTPGGANVFRPLMLTLLRHVSRWRSFTLFAGNQFPAFHFSSQLRFIDAPNLEAFCIFAQLDDGRIIHHPTAIGLSNVPNTPVIFHKGVPKLSLLHVDISGLYFFLPPLSKISTFHAVNPVKNNIIALINAPSSRSLFQQSFAHLTNLTLDHIFLAPNHPIGVSVACPKLLHLRISSFPINWNLFPRWDLPLLETLTFHKTSFNSLRTTPPVDAPNLRSLFLVDCDMALSHGSGIFSLTQLTRIVTKIVLSDSRRSSPPGINPTEFLSYAYSENSWPALQDLTINLYNPGKFGLELIEIFQRYPKFSAITLRVDPSVLASWRASYALRLELLEDICRIEPLDASIPYIPCPWPVSITTNGAFGSLYAKLNPPLIKRYPLTP